MTAPDAERDRRFAAHRVEQVRAGLALTPRQRLQWLEETMAEMRELLGRARPSR